MLWMLRILLVLGFVAGFDQARARVTIDTCGSSTYDCPQPDNAKDFGSPVVGEKICDEATGKCAYVGNQPGAALSKPSSWTAHNQPPSQTAQSLLWGYGAGTFLHETAPQACQAWLTFSQSQGQSAGLFYGETFNVTANFAECRFFGIGGAGCNAPTGCNLVDVSRVATCPAGYVVSGGNCNLSNASQVVKPLDGKCNVIRTGNSYAGDPMDPDCSIGTPGSSAQATNLSVSGGTVSASGGGNNVAVQTDAGTGVTNITNNVSNTTNNTTTTTIVQTTAPPGGTGVPSVSGTSTATTQGTGTLNNPSAPAEPSSELDTSSLNQEATQSQIKSLLDPGATPTTLTPQEGTFDAAVTAHTTKQGAVAAGDKVTSLGVTFGIVFPEVSCTNPAFPIPGTGKTLTVSMCERRADVTAVMAWLLSILTALYVFRLIYEIH